MTLNELAQDAGFIINPIGQIVTPAPYVDARPHLVRLLHILSVELAKEVESTPLDDWEKGYNGGIRASARALVYVAQS